MKVNLDIHEMFYLLESCLRGSHLRSSTILRYVDDWYNLLSPSQRHKLYEWTLRQEKETVMNLNELRNQAYRNAVAHGWHEENLSNEHFLCLVISELMEAVEADRKGKHAKVEMFKEWQGNIIPLTEETRTRGFIEDFDGRN